MKSRRTPRFKKLLVQLPAHVQEQAEKAYQQFQRDPSHPGLEFKQVKSRKSLYSARVGDHYRVLASNLRQVAIMSNMLLKDR